MTGAERITAVFTGNQPDRVPFISAATMYAGSISGLSSEEFYLNPQLSYKAQKRCISLHGCDGGPGFDLPGWISLDFGTVFEYSKGYGVKMPKIIDYPIKSLGDIERIKLPDLSSSNIFKIRRDFYRLAYNDGLAVNIPAGSAFEILSHIMEPQLLLKWLRRETNAVTYLLSIVTEHLKNIAKAYIEEFGVDKCSTSSTYPMDSNDIISPKMFEKVSFPFIQDIHSYYMELGIKSFSLHLCGNHTRNIELFKSLDLPKHSFISVSENVDILEMGKMFGSNYIMGGNVPTMLLTSGTYDEVYNSSVEIIKKMKYHDGGFILMPSCDLPPNALPLNIHAMLNASIDEGWY